MSTAIASKRSLQKYCDNAFAATGTIGYLALLKADLSLNLSFSATAAADALTTASAHGLTTGSRVRVAVAGGTAPTPLTLAQDYYAIVTGATTLKLATTIDNALASTAIDLSDAGSGTLTLNEQELSQDDPIAVLLAKELSHPNWLTRAPITDVGVATVSGAAAEKIKAFAIQNTNVAALTYKHAWLLVGPGVTGAIGSATGILTDHLTTEAIAQTLAQGESKSIVLKLRVLPA
jgi:hypothetical protein